MEKQRSSQGLRSFCLVILLWHCFSDDTLIILYTLYRIYMYLDAMEQIINTDAKPFLYSLLEATWCRWTDTISCYFLYIYIYILHDILYDLFRCFWCFLSVVVLCRCGIIISIIWWYPVRCLLLDIHVVVTGWCGASQVECARVTSCLAPCRGCARRILFFFNFSYLSFFFFFIIIHRCIYIYILADV